MSARPTRRQPTGSIRPQRPTKRPSTTGCMAKMTTESAGEPLGPDEVNGDERPDHARSLRMAAYAVAGVVLFAAAFIVLVLALNQLPLR